MKVKIKSYYVDLEGYLSTDKVYDVIAVWSDNLVVIVNDEGDQSIIRLSSCSHLNGGSWEIVND